MTITLDTDNVAAFKEAVAVLDSMRPRTQTQNLGVAIAVLLHRDVAPAPTPVQIFTPTGSATSTGDLQSLICDPTWRKDNAALPDGFTGPIYKPFGLKFLPESGGAQNNWRNSFDPQGGLGCDAPYTDEFLLDTDFLSQPRYYCTFRDDATMKCLSPAGMPGDKDCFNPNKNHNGAPVGPSTNARMRPKLLSRGIDSGGTAGYWYVEPTVEALTSLLGSPLARVPLYPLSMALYGGSDYWSSLGGTAIFEGRLQSDLGLGDPEFFALFDPDPASALNAQFLSKLTFSSASSSKTTIGPAPAPTTLVPGLPGPLPFVERTIDDIKVSAGRVQDPEQRAALLERATKGHQRALNALSHHLSAAGYVCDVQSGGYDLRAVHVEHGSHLFEVKTWTDSNLAKQVRGGWAQLYEYRYRNANLFEHGAPALYLVLDREPPHDHWAWDWLADGLKVLPCWIGDEGDLVTFAQRIGSLPPTA